MNEWQAIIGHLVADKEGGVLATLVTVEGSSYRRPGARMLVTGAGVRIGSISGGCLEEDLIERSARVRSGGKPELVVYDTTTENDLVWGVGLGCHGIVRILLEPVAPRPEWAVAAAENLKSGKTTEIAVVWEGSGIPEGTCLADKNPSGRTNKGGVFMETIRPPAALAIFGAGDDAQPLARIAMELGWRVTIADPRPSKPTQARFPGAAGFVLGPAEELVARAAPAPGSLAVIMTHHYRHDLPLLRHLLPLPLAYLGLLGPRVRADRLLSEIADGGLAITPAMRSRLHAPVGLDLGADSPEEVALSIIAEMRASLAGRDARPLRERSLPIHA
jgi:xanthine dehydrogenase accessory factor